MTDIADPVNVADEPILSDDDIEALNDGGEATATPTSPTDGKQTTPEPKETGSEDEPSDGKATPEGDPKPEEEDGKKSRPDKQTRLDKRFGELTQKIRSEQDENGKKDDAIAALTAEFERITGKKPVLKRDENGEVTVEALAEYQEELADYKADAKVAALEEKLEAGNIANRFDQEVNDSIKKHPMLDPDKDEFDPRVAAAIERAVQKEISPHASARNIKMLKQLSPAAIIDEYMDGVYSARERASSVAANSLDKLKGQSSGMLDADAPAPTQPKDAFEKGFDSDKY